MCIKNKKDLFNVMAVYETSTGYCTLSFFLKKNFRFNVEETGKLEI